MGGKALKTVQTVRLLANDYFALERDVLSRLSLIFPGRKINVAPSYRSKESYGDLDVLLESENLPDDWIESVQKAFSPSEMVMEKNSSVLSFDFNHFQVDLSLVPERVYDFTLSYYSWNDLGNLMGRLAKGMGYELGHEGFAYKLYNENQFADKIQIQSSFDDALKFLGLDPERHRQGFDTIEDVFEYLVSSTYFRSQSFLLESLNSAARTRVRKRPMYAAFLSFLEKNSCQTADRDKDLHLKRGFDAFSGFRDQYNHVLRAHKEQRIIKGHFNAKVVASLTGLEKLELSRLMRKIRTSFSSVDEFNQFILSNDQDGIDRFILAMKDEDDSQALTR